MEVRLHEGLATVFHGEWVERRGDFFVEGVWDGAFSDGAFHKTDVFYGSGAILSGNVLTVVPSAATTDAVYYVHEAKTLVVSNSFPLALAWRGENLDPRLADYVAINESILRGIGSYVSEIPTTLGSVKRLIHRNLAICGAELKAEDKPWPPHFGTFREYEKYLTSRGSKLFENARDRARTRPLHVFSTQSTGYDTTAMNATLARYGIDLVFTVPRGKGKQRFADRDRALEVDDDGSPICDALGLKCQPVGRRAFERQSAEEHLFYCAVHETADLSFLGMMPYISGPALFLTGCLGEIHAPYAYYVARHGKHMRLADLERGDLGGGHGLGEVRLTRGFVTVPPFCIGARRREEIIRITESSEMDPWRLGTAYDRPIARRLAEERGVPRLAFGQEKKAAAVVLSVPNLPAGRALRDEYLRYLRSSGLATWWEIRSIRLAQRLNALIWFTTPNKYRVVYFAQRVLSRLLGRSFQFPLIFERLRAGVFCFSVNKRVREYRTTMRAAAAGR